jgi:hypothetical protein
VALEGSRVGTATVAVAITGDAVAPGIGVLVAVPLDVVSETAVGIVVGVPGAVLSVLVQLISPSETQKSIVITGLTMARVPL